MGNNAIVDLTPLGGMTGLSRLGASRNQIASLAPLAGSQLTSLEADHNRITDLAPLENLAGLWSLDLADNQIVDISPLAVLANLEWVDLDENQIVDISPLAGHPKIFSLDLHGNRVRDLSPLRDSLSPFYEFDLGSNSIEAPPGSANREVIDSWLKMNRRFNFGVQVIASDLAPRIETTPGGGIRLSFMAGPGYRYRLQRSTDARSWSSFDTDGDIPGLGSRWSIDIPAPLPAKEFYRVEAHPW